MSTLHSPLLGTALAREHAPHRAHAADGRHLKPAVVSLRFGTLFLKSELGLDEIDRPHAVRAFLPGAGVSIARNVLAARLGWRSRCIST
jgi:hypothetical protein